MNSVFIIPPAEFSIEFALVRGTSRALAGPISLRTSRIFPVHVRDQVGRLVRVHFLQNVGGFFGVQLLDDLRVQAFVQFGEGFGGGFLVEGSDDGLALDGRELPP